ncbi:MAG TPA: mechanosensitive ion channel family protein [Actinomycetota bacterium]|nr:mechanosensitive ion channel family protein [Actinomycetota bacterium]
MIGSGADMGNLVAVLASTDILGEPVTLSPGGVSDAFREFAERLVAKVPNLVTAVVVLLLTVLVARLVRRGIDTALRRTSTEAHVNLLVAKLGYFGVVLVGVVVTLSIAGVSISVLVGSLGLVTVALGFALQDILSNFVAGIVLLLEHPFTKGDHIVTAEVAGVVEDIRVRATRLRTSDGQLVVVPNKLLFTQVLKNSSATTGRRLEVAVRVPHGQDLARIREALPDIARAVDGVLAAPAPSVLTTDLATDALELRLLVWADPRASDLERVRSEVLDAVERALGELGVRAEGSAADDVPATGKSLDLDT